LAPAGLTAIKPFFFVTNAPGKKAGVFVRYKSFQRSPIFVSKASALPNFNPKILFDILYWNKLARDKHSLIFVLCYSYEVKMFVF
jgi:hypothetical protein